MKRKFCLIIMLLLSLSGCHSVEQAGEELHILTSFYPIYLLAEEITDGVAGIRLENMAQPETGCLHDYSLTTTDMQKLAQADVLLINGGGMEAFLQQAQSQFPALTVIDTSHGIAFLESGHHHEHGEEEHDAHDAEEGNAHIWLSPERCAQQVKQMAEELAEMLPEARTQILENADRLTAELADLEQAGAALAQQCEGTSAAIFHEGYTYITELLHMDAAVQIFIDEYEVPSAKAFAAAADEIQEKNIDLYLTADDAGKKYAQTLATEQGGQVVVLNPLTGSEAGTDFVAAMVENLEKIRIALEGENTNDA